MGVATTTDTTNSVRTILKNLYRIYVQVNETTKKETEKCRYDLNLTIKVLKSTQNNIV